MDRRHTIEPGTTLCDLNQQTARVLAVDTIGKERLAVASLEDQTKLCIPFSLLARDGDVHRYAGSFSELAKLAPEGRSMGERSAGQESLRIPVVAEEIQVSREQRETGAGVRITKHVHQEEQTVDLPLNADEYIVEHIPRNELLPEEGAPPSMRNEEDGTMVFPVLEEVLVVQKRLRLREEIRITRRQREFHSPQQVLVRREEVDVQKFGHEQS